MKSRILHTKPSALLEFGLLAMLLLIARSGKAQAGHESMPLIPKFSTAKAFDVSLPVRDLAWRVPSRTTPLKFPPMRRPVGADRGLGDDDAPQSVVPARGFAGDGALQTGDARQATALIPAPLVTFEGLANSDNFSLFGFRVSPPDPNGEVGPNHYVQMVNLVFAVYAKDGTRLLGPTSIGALWSGFAVDDCTDLSGDPVVLYDQLEDRWILTQFTTRGPTFFNCVAVSQTGDPTGAYFRYAFSTGENFPDYPKYGVWPNAYFISTREFAPDNSFAGDGAYALERDKILAGDPAARMVKFLLTPGTTPYLPGDGLLPSDLDGQRRPPAGSPNYFVGTMDDGAGRGAPFDGINIFQFSVHWKSNPTASFTLQAQLAVAQFDSIFPCSPGSRNCIPQPGTTNKIDILSYRQRPTFRLAYRNFGTFEALVTNQSVEALPGIAGVRWYEIRRVGGVFSLNQQGTYAPDDGVNRWMGSVAMDKLGNMALGFSVSNATTVFPGIRYTGRLAGDPLGEMTLGEGVLIDGSGSQTVSARWGDYTDITVDPTDDCTFWYVNEYYQVSSARGWQTRIGSFKLPGCQ
jgi:hypothetical protein